MLTRSPGRLETALYGGPVHPSVAAEVELARTVGVVRLDLEPDPEFVAALRERLVGEPVDPVLPRPRRVRVARAVRAAGAVVGLAVIGIVWWSSRPGPRLRPAQPGDPSLSRPC